LLTKRWTETEYQTNPKQYIMSTTDKLATDLKRIVRASEELLHTTRDAVGETTEEVDRQRVEDSAPKPGQRSRPFPMRR